MNTILNKFLLIILVLGAVVIAIGACGEKDNCMLDCANGGTCAIGQNGAPTCLCPPNYIGTNCGTFDPCNRVFCRNGGTCTFDNAGNTSCNCLPGYFGEFCETFDSCFQVICPSTATCNNGTCICNTGYAGDSCNILIQTQYIGNYQVTDSCIQMTSNVAYEYNTTIEAGDRMDEIIFTNFSHLDLAVIGKVSSLTRFFIPEQTFNNTTIVSDTTGIFNPVGVVAVTLSYTITTDGQREDCTMVLKR